MTAKRFEFPIFRTPGDGNIAAGHPAERAAWIWAPGRVADVTAAVALSGPGALGYHDIGPQFHFDLAAWREADRALQKPEVLRAPLAPNIHGVRTPGWVLATTPLPEQRREPFSGGRIRAVRAWTADNTPWEESADADCAAWNALLASGRSVEIPTSTAMEILWDFELYECGYPSLAWSGGAGAEVHFHWAESLHEHHPDSPLDAESPKGHRSEIAGKVWLGFDDSFVCSGADFASAPALWWRSGRYVRLRIRTGRAPLRLECLGILTTGYPLERGWRWESSDPEWDGVLPLIARGLELGTHETWADSPYYEQMTYVGTDMPSH